ncbi:hypothetical protein [Arthrobacter glacialis]|uniref:N-acetyltransferase domain-containing protein n=1 Tax=Arthrobacter glacialis TaxID=1664 RepID=A0A2S3ZUI9_ARTGL|nr:hypothetical protein [Arthrobacter glacialis]POH72517.1 hypothetical protein CVS27_15465 [Arthrobacter glacialis]
MKKATLGQVPTLAWISAQAFTQRRKGTGKWPALLAYPAHLFTALVMTVDGVLYQDSSEAIVVVKDQRRTSVKGIVVGAALVFMLFLPALPAITGDFRAFPGLLFTVIVVGALFASIFSILPNHGRGASEAALSKAVKAAANGRQAFTFSLLARSLEAQPGAGAKLLNEAVDELAGQGAVVGCIAANQELIPFYNRFGLQQIGQTQMMLNPAWDTAGRGAEK